MSITKNGRKLASTLNPLIGTTIQIENICSTICRYATTHHKLAEDECNFAMTESQQEAFDKRVEWIEKRITELVEQLPETPDGPLVPHFQGDPRGATVKLLIKGFERHPSYDGWALEAIIVPTGNH